MELILTGGAGFIGSCFLGKINQAGITRILVVDELNDEKQKNLINKKFSDYLEKDVFLELVQRNSLGRADALVHLGACSSTTETDADYLMRNNFQYSRTLAQWALQKNTSFLYASSGATYGSGEHGFNDGDENTLKLKPLNPYGVSKQLFDLWVVENNLSGKVTGFKFFNVFGPNEYHKGEMRSVVLKSYEKIKKEGRITLFKSHRQDCKDGEQKRDFIYVKDALEVMYYFLTNPDKKGIFNVGTGKARTFNDLVQALFSSLGLPARITYVDMPENIRHQYQYFTQADLGKLRKAGCNHQFLELEPAVADYVQYLEAQAYL